MRHLSNPLYYELNKEENDKIDHTAQVLDVHGSSSNWLLKVSQGNKTSRKGLGSICLHIIWKHNEKLRGK